VGTGPFDRNTGGNNLTAKLLTNIFCTSTATIFTPGTGGTAMAVTLPFKARLMGTAGSDTANGTELSASTGYTAGGTTMGTTAFSYSAGVISSANAVSWTAGGTWGTVNGLEIWDSAGTPLRYLQTGNSTFSAITGITTGDTVQFPAASITYDGTAW
jgi:hypothetical protein